MNINIGEAGKKCFSQEDIMSYSNIEITNANDNRAPARVIAVKVIIGAIIVLLVLAVFFV